MLAALKALSENRFVRNVGLLASGTIAGQAIMVLILPVLTRIYEPEAFGLLGVYMSLLMILSVSACLRFDIATPLPEHDADAINLVALGVLAATTISIALAIPVFLMPDRIVGWLDQPEMRQFLWMFPLGVWLAAVYSAVQFWSIRKGRYPYLAKIQLTRALGGAGTQVGIGTIQPGAFGLLFGHMLYTGLGTVGLTRLLWIHDRQLLPGISLKSLRENFLAQKRFPLFSVPEAFLNHTVVNIPIVLIAAVAGPNEAGFLLLAQRVTSIPVALLGGSISRVYLAEATEKISRGELGPFTRQIMRTLLKMGLVPFMVLAIAAPVFFPFIFGSDWVRAGSMVAWMVPHMLIQFVVSPVSTILHATGNQALALGLQIFGFVLMIGSILVASRIQPSHVFEVYAVAAAIYYASYLAIVLSLSRSR